MAIRAVSIDVGGVLVVPNGDRLAGALQDVGILTADAGRADLAHHVGVAALDATRGSWDAYLTAHCIALGTPVQALRAAVPAAQAAFEGRSDLVWNEVRPDARDGLAALADLGMPLVVTSNSDGYVEALVDAQLSLCQVGPGAGAQVVTIIDSAVVGVAKPARGIFDLAVAAVGCAHEEVLHVGDTVSIDIVGAADADLLAVHLDPHDLCADTGHLHARTLTEVATLASERS